MGRAPPAPCALFADSGAQIAPQDRAEPKTTTHSGERTGRRLPPGDWRFGLAAAGRSTASVLPKSYQNFILSYRFSYWHRRYGRTPDIQRADLRARALGSFDRASTPARKVHSATA